MPKANEVSQYKAIFGWKKLKNIWLENHQFYYFQNSFSRHVRNVYCTHTGHSDRHSESFADRPLKIEQTWSSMVNSEFHGELQVLGD